MGINLGSSGLSAIQRGSGSIQRVYKGTEEIFAAGPVPGEVLAVPLSSAADIDGTDTFGGTVTFEPAIGSFPGPSGNVLTIESTATTRVTARIDLGTTYNNLYISFYANVIDGGGATGAEDMFAVGPDTYELNGASTVKIQANLDSANNRSKPFGQPLGRFLKGANKYGTWNKYGVVIDRVAQTVDYYRNGVLMNSGTTNDSDLRYIIFGGRGLPLGLKWQFYGLTVNDSQLQDSYSIPELNGVADTVYIDGSLDPLIDASTFSGKVTAPYDPDGGVAYIDGPLRHISDVSADYLVPPTDFDAATARSKILFKRGVEHRVETLSLGHTKDLGTGATSATKNYEIGTYGTGTIPSIMCSILADQGSWTVHDAPNSIYKQTISQPLTNAIACWSDENLGLGEQDLLVDLETYPGSCYFDTGTSEAYVRMWDDSNPSSAQIDIATNQGLNIDEFCTIRGVKVMFGQIKASVDGIVEDCELTKGGSIGCSENSIVRNNHIYERWGGKDYAIAGKANAGTTNAIITSTGCVVYNNTVEDSYIGIQSSYDVDDVLIAFNVFKNIIVNTVSLSGGGVPNDATYGNAIRIVNNTIFHGVRTINNDPYPLAASSLGHGIVCQNIVSGTKRLEIINNLVLVHRNIQPPNVPGNVPGAGTSNAIAGLEAVQAVDVFGRIDYNKYYITPTSDSTAIYFTSSVNPQTIERWRTVLGGTNWTNAVDAATPEGNTITTNTLPVAIAVAAQDTGKFGATNPTPATTGDGFVYDFSAWPEIEADLGSLATGVTRNIGAK